MTFFMLLVISSIIFIATLIWIVPLILSWIFEFKFKVKLTIGLVILPYLKLKDVHISNNIISVAIDEVKFTSKLFNSDITKLLAIIFKDIRINRVVPISQTAHFDTQRNPSSITANNFKIPPSFIKFLQFTLIQFINISIVWTDHFGWLIHTTSSEIKLETQKAISGDKRETVLNVTTLLTTTKVRRRALENIDYAEVNYSIISNITLSKLPTDKIQICIQKPHSIINAELFKYFKRNSSATQKESFTTVSSLTQLIPKNFIVSIEDTEIITNFSNGKIITTSFNSCKINSRRIEDNQLSFYFASKLDNFLMLSSGKKLFSLKYISTDAKIQKNIVNIYIIINTISGSLDRSLWPKLDFEQAEQKPEVLDINQNRLNKWNIECCLELWSAKGFLKGDLSIVSCGHCKVVLERTISQQWSAEILSESLGWSLVGLSSLDRRNHIIGTPLYLAVALIKLSYSKNNCRLDAMLDTLRTEWNTTLINMLILDQDLKTSDHKYNENKPTSKFPEIFTANIAISNCNSFFFLENTANISMRLDSILLEGTEKKCTIQLSGYKLIDNDLSKKQFNCARSEDIISSSASINSAHAELILKNKELKEWTLNILDEFYFDWNFSIHMKLVTVFRSFCSTKPKAVAKKDRKILYNIYLRKTSFKACVGVHTIQLDSSYASFRGSPFTLDFDDLKLSIDDTLIAIGISISLDQNSTNEKLCEERAAADGLECSTNTGWIFKMDTLEIRFPYNHDFADAIQNEFSSAFKWLKIVHNKKKTPFTLESPLPNDLLIMINECLIEICDDPFEVRLRDNYELLVDEYKESLKRQQKLDTKISELCKTHLLLPAGKVDDLYANLSKKNAEIYIQRSKQITSTNPPRTRLLEWHSYDLTIVALADLSYHGTERVLSTMQRVDPTSPFPVEGLTCSTLWARMVTVILKQSTVSLRDFPQPFLECRGLHLWGTLVGAEAAPTVRSIRHVIIDLPEPWGSMVVERSMNQLKFYHDFNIEMEHYSYAFGPCWEPVIAQCNLSMERIISPSRDPSPPLPFWDKCRLLFHGRLTMLVHHMTVLLHASLDPYNTTEEMELAWNDMVLDWVDGKITIKGDFDIYVRTASKYDDCRLLHLPNVKLTFKLDWICLADPNDHHSIIPCAPDKVPEYSSNQEHDSYRAFRSQNVDVSLSLEAKGTPTDYSILLLYGSTLRWFESLKFILSGVTRPTRRGAIFGAIKPRRKQLSRHYRRVRILLALHRFQISYWMSCAMQHGCEVIGNNRLVCSSAYNLTLTPMDGNLKRRPRANWSISYMNCELTDAEVWLKSALQTSDGDDDSEYSDGGSKDETPPPVEKYYCLSVEKVSYGRETPYVNSKDTPTHKLVVHDLRGAWTKNNRDVAFALFDVYMKSQQLRKNLSADALKISTNQENVHMKEPLEPESSIPSTDGTDSILHPHSPASMLEQLIAEADNKTIVVFSDDQSPSGRQTRLQGLQACQQDDVLHKNWLIALVNAQVVLRGCETKGYVILSAAKAEILQRIHDPESKQKRTWVGSLECLQYFATVGAGDEDIMWLPVEYIQEQGVAETDGPAAVVGSGRAAGGVVSQVVGAAGRQLQRIVSRCRCEFFYVSYGSLNPSGGPSSDAFTLMHHDLDVCTNSLQYAMLLDIVNSLLLWVEPTRKEAAARLARLRFQLQLRSDRSVRVPVQKLQTQVRGLLGALRRLERDAYLAGNSAAASRIHAQLMELKTELSARTEELEMLLAIHRGSAPHTTVRAHEICFKHAQWRLTDADGQLGIADLVLSNFLYTKNSKSDDSVEHLLELGYIHMTNLLPNQAYTEVLSPTEIQRDMPVDHKHVLRIFCRERPPVGGISVKEHFEINVVPITIGLTKKFYNTLLKFCFPERDDPDAMQSKVSKDTSFYVRINQKDDVEKMKERAEKNKLFIYIKIPEVPVRVSYKGNKEKNIEDVRDFSLVIPTLEYHNVTWTWLDLLLAMKSDTRKVILSQAIKQKLQIHRNRGSTVDNNTPLEEDKARMLLGKLSLSK